MQTQIISIINQKGGVGKTTTTQTLGASLAQLGYKVLMIDLDQQSNLSYITATDKNGTITDVLAEDKEIAQVIQSCGRYDVIASSPLLLAVEIKLMETSDTEALKKKLKPLIWQNRYNFILLDTPPQLSQITLNALTASNSLIVITQADVLSLQALGRLNSTIKAVKSTSNSDLDILGIVITRWNSRTIIAQNIADLMEDTAKKLNTKLFSTKIREGVAIKEAQALQQDVIEYARTSNPAQDYMKLAQEIIDTIKEADNGKKD